MQAPLQGRNDSDAVQTKTARTATQERMFVDNRPAAVAQSKLADMMNNSPRVLQQRALSDAIHNSPRMVAQRHEINALFGGAVQPQGDGTMSAEASPAQREEKTNNIGLPNQLKSGIESLSGMSMDHVKVHYNSNKPAQLQAHAYSQGNEIHLGAGQERHLPHEAWHVVQQAQGRVRPTLQMKAGAVNDDPSLEKEADIMGEKAARFKGDHDARNLVAEERVAAVVTQCVAGFPTLQINGQTLVNDDAALESEADLMAARAGNMVLQRQVKTNGGEFTTTRYEAINETSAGENQDQTAAGAQMKLAFQPHVELEVMSNQVKQIGLIQTVKTLRSSEEVPLNANIPDTPLGNPLKEQFKLTAEEGDLGRGIDKFDRSPNDDEAQVSPLYASMNERGSFPTSLGASRANAGFGQHWQFFKPEKPAELYDRPIAKLEFPAQSWTMSFEVAALVTEGTLTGTYLGSVAWGWEKPSGQEARLAPNPISLVSAGVPSEHFLSASKKWNESNNGVREGSDGQLHALIKIPINNARFAHSIEGSPDAEQSVCAYLLAYEAVHSGDLEATQLANTRLELERWRLRLLRFTDDNSLDLTGTVNAQSGQYGDAAIQAALKLVKPISEEAINLDDL